MTTDAILPRLNYKFLNTTKANLIMKLIEKLQEAGIRLDQIFTLIQIVRRIRRDHDSMVDKGFPGLTPQEVYHLVCQSCQHLDEHLASSYEKVPVFDGRMPSRESVNSLWTEVQGINDADDTVSYAVAKASSDRV